MSKYHNVKTKLDGYTFDSKAEAARYAELRLMEKANEIEQLQVHPRYEIWVHEDVVGPISKTKVCTYISDFEYVKKVHGKWKLIVEDVKGVRTAVYRLKKNLLKACYGIDVVEINVRKGKRGSKRRGLQRKVLGRK